MLVEEALAVKHFKIVIKTPPCKRCAGRGTFLNLVLLCKELSVNKYLSKINCALLGRGSSGATPVGFPSQG